MRLISCVHVNAGHPRQDRGLDWQIATPLGLVRRLLADLPTCKIERGKRSSSLSNTSCIMLPLITCNLYIDSPRRASPEGRPCMYACMYVGRDRRDPGRAGLQSLDC
jgi:hypothetical protein